MAEPTSKLCLSRRQFMAVSAASAAAATAGGVALAACQPRTVIVEQEKVVRQTVEQVVTREVTKEVMHEVTRVIEVKKLVTPTAAPGRYRESPVDAALAAAGKLPPVDERMPAEPLVIVPYEEIGQYGGQIRVGAVDTAVRGADAQLISAPENPLRLTPNLRDATPNLLKEWRFSADFEVLTGTLRRGIKWSDGEPVTIDDFMFGWEDVHNNLELWPVPQMYFQPGGKLMGVEKLDDYAFRLTFAAPNPGFVLLCLAHYYGFWGGDLFLVPAHYLKQFHKKYNPRADELAKEAKLDFWYNLFGYLNASFLNMERPHLMTHTPVDDRPERVLSRRNSFFWMADQAGNQLPYIEEIYQTRPADLALHTAKIVTGAYDFVGFDTNIQNYKTYADAAPQGDYHVVLWRSGKGSDVVYNVNCIWGLEKENPDARDAMMRQIFMDDRFRRALSLAINRDEVNQVLYLGHGDPRQMTVIPDSRHFKPEYASAWAQYDVAQANKLLDEMGLKWATDKSRRTWPDGMPLTIAWDMYESETPKGPTTELIKEYWLKAGVEIVYKSITRELLYQRVLANLEPMSLWHGDETTDVLFLRRPKFFAPDDSDETCWGILWGRYYHTQGQQGIKPPPAIQELYDWIDRYNETDEDEWAAKALRSQAEHVWTIGVVGNAPHPLIVNNKLANVSPDGYWVWDSLWTYPVYPEQWFFRH